MTLSIVETPVPPRTGAKRATHTARARAVAGLVNRRFDRQQRYRAA